MHKIEPQPGIMEIDLYVGGKSRLAGHDEVLKLSSNENPLGSPPVAAQVLARAAGDVHLYPPTDHADLRAAIGAVHGLDPERIICGVGSDEVLQFVTQAFSGPGDEIIHTEHGFRCIRSWPTWRGRHRSACPRRGAWWMWMRSCARSPGGRGWC